MTLQQVYDDFDEAWIPRSLYDRRTQEVEALQAQIEQLRNELGALERRLKAWEITAT